MKANRIKLLNEAKKLIHEFEEIIGGLGFNLMTDVCVNEESFTIVAKDPNNDTLELELYEVAKIHRYFIDGWGPCSGDFDEEIDLRICDIEEDYKEKSKEEFINYVGNLYYAKYRCEEIYKRLKEIECE